MYHVYVQQASEGVLCFSPGLALRSFMLEFEGGLFFIGRWLEARGG